MIDLSTFLSIRQTTGKPTRKPDATGRPGLQTHFWTEGYAVLGLAVPPGGPGSEPPQISHTARRGNGRTSLGLARSGVLRTKNILGLCKGNGSHFRGWQSGFLTGLPGHHKTGFYLIMLQTAKPSLMGKGTPQPCL